MNAFCLRNLLASVLGLLLLIAPAGPGLLPAGRAQLPLPASGADSADGSAGADPATEAEEWWDTGRAYRCGRLWCSDVVLPYLPLLLERAPIVVAVAGTPETAEVELTARAERRSAAVVAGIEGTVRQLQRHIHARSTPSPVRAPRVEVGVENAQRVIFVVADPALGVAQQTIATVTLADARHAGLPGAALAERWRGQIQMALREASRGIAFDRRHPLGRWLIVAGFLGLGVAMALGLRRLRQALRQLRLRLQRRLETIETAAREESLAAYTASTPFTAMVTPDGLRSPRVLRPAMSLLSLLHRLLTIAMVASLLTAVVLGFLVFPATRPHAVFLIKQALVLPLLWLGLVVLQPLLAIGIDHLLDRWARTAAAGSATSRQELRVGTYAKVGRLAAGLFCAVAGLYATVLVLGVDPRVLAGAGVLAVAIGFLARNLLEDIVNGAMILINDRYAIGDVIRIGAVGGLVEDMNLHVTRLRGSDGQLTSIPNRRIEVVENLTQNWSRVDFSVRVAAEADPRRALRLIEAEARRLWEEPEWGRLLREPPSVLGIDEIAHDGTLIRVWIATQPLQQWLVGREFRLRIKLALQQAGIGLGVPQRQLTLQRSQVGR
jgi:small conductance mechanosensitive channel